MLIVQFFFNLIEVKHVKDPEILSVFPFDQMSFLPLISKSWNVSSGFSLQGEF